MKLISGRLLAPIFLIAALSGCDNESELRDHFLQVSGDMHEEIRDLTIRELDNGLKVQLVGPNTVEMKADGDTMRLNFALGQRIQPITGERLNDYSNIETYEAGVIFQNLGNIDNIEKITGLACEIAGDIHSLDKEFTTRQKEVLQAVNLTKPPDHTSWAYPEYGNYRRASEKYAKLDENAEHFVTHYCPGIN